MIVLHMIVTFILAFTQVALAELSEERFVQTPLDHYDPQNLETWTMVVAGWVSYAIFTYHISSTHFRDTMQTTLPIKMVDRYSSMWVVTMKLEHTGLSMVTCTTSRLTLMVIFSEAR